MIERYSISIEGSDISTVTIGSACDMGKRDYQEDSAAFCGFSSGCAAVVADGMGGLKGGRQLSELVVDKMLGGMKAFKADSPVNGQFAALIDQINRPAAGSGSGSTVCAVYCCPNGVFWCSVGDSRLYHIRKSKICRLTEDGDYFNMLLERVLKGTLSLEEADNDPERDYLYQYIGASRQLSPDCNVRPLVPEAGDALLVCSDGVYNTLSDAELARYITEDGADSADRIVRQVMARNVPSQDNLTALVMVFGADVAR